MKYYLSIIILFAFALNISYSSDNNSNIIAKSIKAIEKRKTLGDECYIQNYIADFDFSKFQNMNNSPSDSIESEIPDMPMKLSIPIRIYHAGRDKMRLEINVMTEKMIIIKNGDKIFSSFSDDHIDTLDLKDKSDDEDNQFMQIFDYISIKNILGFLKNDNYSKINLGIAKDSSGVYQKIQLINRLDTSHFFVDSTFLYIDRKTNLPKKSELTIDVRDTKVKLEFGYGDYNLDKKYFICNGFKFSLNIDEKRNFDINVTQSKIEFKDKLDEKLFEIIR